MMEIGEKLKKQFFNNESPRREQRGILVD